ncbi:CZB domain-containing protein [Rufibacter roseus]|uniref:CZB domain-containing protein n=1 Tax=Rufibacter roseus TaxID=1567108 RepID=A0ABW2DNW7_9BACT|nr:CZB domain-containing protein [Rufibacter roseus]
MLYTQVNLEQFDIQQARIKFILFKSKLRAILYGGDLDDAVLSPRENAFGKWLYSEALQKLSNNAEVRELEKLNMAFTRKASELISLYRKGKIEEARTGLREIEEYEEDLLRLLSLLQRNTAA